MIAQVALSEKEGSPSWQAGSISRCAVPHHIGTLQSPAARRPLPDVVPDPPLCESPGGAALLEKQISILCVCVRYFGVESLKESGHAFCTALCSLSSA